MAKDKNAPKRPLSGYMRFIGSIRKKVEKETGLNGIQVTKHLSAAWNKLSDAEKEKYNKAGAKEMVVYKKKMAAYKKTDAYKQFLMKKKMKKAGGKKPKDKNAPKRPASGYFLFLKDVRNSVVAKHPKWGVAEIGKAIGKMWASLDDAKKSKYMAKAEKLKESWQAKKAKYEKSSQFKAYQAKVAEWKAKCKAAQKEAKAALKGDKISTKKTKASKKRKVKK